MNGIVAEVAVASDAYEAALAAGDVEALVAAFWVSDEALRIGDDEELYGWEAISAHRRDVGSSPVDRRVLRRDITALGTDVAMVNIVSDYPGEGRSGRQSQVWIRTQDGWRIAQAHVSWPLRSARGLGIESAEERREQS